MIKKILFIISLSCSLSLFGQEIEILVLEEPPFVEGQEIHIEVYLTNTTDSALTYFDSRGPCWESFKEVWDLNVENTYVEILPLNGAHHHKFTDSTLITLPPAEKALIRERAIPLKIAGSYSFTYTQEQGYDMVNKDFADATVSDSALQKINTFTVSKNIKFEVFREYDTTIHEIINMSWEDWEDYRHAKLYSRDKHFDNMYAALRYPQDVYALTLFCNGLEEEMIKRIGSLKNLRALTLRNYTLNYFPKEIADLELYELTIVPKTETAVSFPHGISNNNTLRELHAKFYAGIPPEVMHQSELRHLDISDCPITTLPRLDSLQKLEVLVANNCELSTLKNAGFDQLISLKDLTLSGNKAVDDLEPILHCTNLEFLVINRTRISTIPDAIENLRKLKKLTVSSHLTAISDSLGKLDDMRYLSFGGNRELTSIPQSIIQMKKLLHLDVSNTKIDELPEGLAELPLEHVFIYNTDCKKTKDYKQLKNRLDARFKD